MKVCSHDYNISCKRIAPPRKRIKTQTVISQQAVGTTIYWRQCSAYITALCDVSSPYQHGSSVCAQRGPERPREAHRGGAWIEQACHALGWRIPTRRFTTREAPHFYAALVILLHCTAGASTRSLLESFFRDLGPFKKAASQYVSC